MKKWGLEETKRFYKRCDEKATRKELMQEFGATYTQVASKIMCYRRSNGEIKGRYWSDEDTAAIMKRFDEGASVKELMQEYNATLSQMTSRYNLYIKQDPSRKRNQDRTADILRAARAFAEDPNVDLDALSDIPQHYLRVVEIIADHFTLTERV